MKVSDSSELRRSAFASLLVVEVLTNLANREEENAEGHQKVEGQLLLPFSLSEFFKPLQSRSRRISKVIRPERGEEPKALRPTFRSSTERIRLFDLSNPAESGVRHENLEGHTT